MTTRLGRYWYRGFGCRINLEVDIYEKQTRRGTQMFYVWEGKEVVISHDEFENGGWYRIHGETNTQKQLEMF